MSFNKLLYKIHYLIHNIFYFGPSGEHAYPSAGEACRRVEFVCFFLGKNSIPDNFEHSLLPHFVIFFNICQLTSPG